MHILFVDQSVWHDNTGQNETPANPRYATWIGKSWQVTTVLSQQGQTQSSKPIIGFVNHQLVVSATGNEVVVTGILVSWDTDSIYNQQDQSTQLTTQVITLK